MSAVADLLSESSESPFSRTRPEKAYVTFEPVILPSSSTSATLIWTEAWSFAVMSRFVAAHLRGT